MIPTTSKWLITTCRIALQPPCPKFFFNWKLFCKHDRQQRYIKYNDNLRLKSMYLHQGSARIIFLQSQYLFHIYQSSLNYTLEFVGLLLKIQFFLTSAWTMKRRYSRTNLFLLNFYLNLAPVIEVERWSLPEASRKCRT